MSHGLSVVKLLKRLVEDVEAQQSLAGAIGDQIMPGWDDDLDQKPSRSYPPAKSTLPADPGLQGYQELPQPQQALPNNRSRPNRTQGAAQPGAHFGAISGGSITAPLNRTGYSPTAYEFQEDSAGHGSGTRNCEAKFDSIRGDGTWQPDVSHWMQQGLQAVHFERGNRAAGNRPPQQYGPGMTREGSGMDNGQKWPHDKFEDLQRPAQGPRPPFQHSWLRDQGLQMQQEHPTGRPFEQSDPNNQSNLAAQRSMDGQPPPRHAQWEAPNRFDRPPSHPHAQQPQYMGGSQPNTDVDPRPPSQPRPQAGRGGDGWQGQGPGAPSVQPQSGSGGWEEPLSRPSQGLRPAAGYGQGPDPKSDFAGHHAPGPAGQTVVGTPSSASQQMAPPADKPPHHMPSSYGPQGYVHNEQQQPATYSRFGGGDRLQAAREAPGTYGGTSQPAQQRTPDLDSSQGCEGPQVQQSHISQGGGGWQQDRAFHNPSPRMAQEQQPARVKPQEYPRAPNPGQPALPGRERNGSRKEPPGEETGWETAPLHQKAPSAPPWEGPQHNSSPMLPPNPYGQHEVPVESSGSRQQLPPPPPPRTDSAGWDADPRFGKAVAVSQGHNMGMGPSQGEAPSTEPAPPVPAPMESKLAASGWGAPPQMSPAPQNWGDNSQSQAATGYEPFVEPPSDHKAMLERLRKLAAINKAPTRRQLVENARRAGAEDPPPPASSNPNAMLPRQSYGFDFSSHRERQGASQQPADSSAGMHENRAADSASYGQYRQENAPHMGAREQSPTEEWQRPRIEPPRHSEAPLADHSRMSREPEQLAPQKPADHQARVDNAGWERPPSRPQPPSSAQSSFSGWEGNQPTAGPAPEASAGWESHQKTGSGPPEAPKPLPRPAIDPSMRRERSPPPMQTRAPPMQAVAKLAPKAAASTGGGWDAFLPDDNPPAQDCTGWEAGGDQKQDETSFRGAQLSAKAATFKPAASGEAAPLNRDHAPPIPAGGVQSSRGPVAADVPAGWESMPEATAATKPTAPVAPSSWDATPPANAADKPMIAPPLQMQHKPKAGSEQSGFNGHTQKPSSQPQYDRAESDFQTRPPSRADPRSGSTHQQAQEAGAWGSSGQQGQAAPGAEAWGSSTAAAQAGSGVPAAEVPYEQPVMLTREQRQERMKGALAHLGNITSRKQLLENAMKKDEERKARKAARLAEAEAQGNLPSRHAAPVVEEQCQGWGDPDPGKALILGAWNDMAPAKPKPLPAAALAPPKPPTPALQAGGWEPSSQRPSDASHMPETRPQVSNDVEGPREEKVSEHLVKASEAKADPVGSKPSSDSTRTIEATFPARESSMGHQEVEVSKVHEAVQEPQDPFEVSDGGVTVPTAVEQLPKSHESQPSSQIPTPKPAKAAEVCTGEVSESITASKATVLLPSPQLRQPDQKPAEPDSKEDKRDPEAAEEQESTSKVPQMLQEPSPGPLLLLPAPSDIDLQPADPFPSTTAQDLQPDAVIEASPRTDSPQLTAWELLIPSPSSEALLIVTNSASEDGWAVMLPEQPWKTPSIPSTVAPSIHPPHDSKDWLSKEPEAAGQVDTGAAADVKANSEHGQVIALDFAMRDQAKSILDAMDAAENGKGRGDCIQGSLELQKQDLLEEALLDVISSSSGTAKPVF